MRSTNSACRPSAIRRRGCSPPSASVTMNSARSSPTPSTGSAATASACSAIARLTYRRVPSGSTVAAVDGRGGAPAAAVPGPPASARRRGRPRRPCPAAPSTVTSSPLRSSSVASRAPTMHGTPSSRLDDRGVTGDAAAVGDQRAGPPHGRHPVGRRHRRDEDLAGLRACAASSTSCTTRTRPATMPGAAARPLHQRLAGRSGDVERRDRPRLDEEDLVPADRPLHVLRLAVVRLGPGRRGRRAASTSASVRTRGPLRRRRAPRAARTPSGPRRIAIDLWPMRTDSDAGRVLGWRRSSPARPARRRRPRRARTRLDDDAIAVAGAGSTPNMTPERSASTISWITTAMAGSDVMAREARYDTTRSPNSDAQQSTIASSSASSPSTFV